jgi:Ca2+-binding EF-hand superfamily protein
LQKPQVVGGDQQQVNDILFKGLDQDGNGYLEQKELLPRSEFSADFPWMDANHDGKVFLQEFSTFLDRRRAALRARVELTIAEQANQLFELLDANDDGRLTDRELTGARTSFPKWDSNDDGHLVLSEIPHRWQCLFTRGAVSSRGPDSIRIVGGSMNANKAGAGGPVWFRQMDRNQDGEVARREFLGPLSSFDRLDTNRNGALDADEAAMAR